jgi:hypothetical protein
MTKNALLWITTVILISLFSQKTATAQSKNQREKESFADKLVYGGSFGLQFGSLTLVDISPVIGYRITEKLEAGLGFTYKYYKYKDYFYDVNTGMRYDLKSNILGGSVYSRYHILENVFAHVEFEQLSYRYTDYFYAGSTLGTEKLTASISSFFVGGGYRQRISQNSYFYIMGLWNLSEDALSPYNNPVLRMGVILGR